MEFLGDAVLGFAVTDHIHTAYADLSEGELAKLRAALVNAETLACVATDLDLGSHLRLGRGEDRSGGRTKPSILADALESVIGAVHVDAGIDAAVGLVLRLLGDRVTEARDAGPEGFDAKTRLQELAARNGDARPVYEVQESGPDHEKSFDAQVRLGGRVLGAGQGPSKKRAEQRAARHACEVLAGERPPPV